MCGIGGILRVWPVDQRDLALRTPHNQSIPEAWLDTLDDAIKHRGPDGQGRFRDRTLRADGCVVDVAFVHRRLSIIDHAGGAQPMVSSLPLPEGGGRGVGLLDRPTIVDLPPPLCFHGKPNDPVIYRPVPGASNDLAAVVFNGCIYNHRELRAELQRAGHIFTTDHSDTEVLVHGWREWGRELPEWLEGMFTFAVWDHQRGELFIARDRVGEKPLYYVTKTELVTEVNGLSTGVLGVAFCSTTSGIARLPKWTENARSFDSEDLNQILDVDLVQLLQRGFQAPPYEFPGGLNVRRLEPAQRAWFSPASAFPRALRLSYGSPGEEYRCGRSQYWEPPRGRILPLHADYLEMLLEESVEKRMEADVPLACFLSGGVDSSLITHFAVQHTDRLRSFCVRMPDARYDESEYAKQVAAHLGVQHDTLDCPVGTASDLELLIAQMGLPLGDSSLLPTHWVSKAAAGHAKVVLTGDGGDELFCGYERYVAAESLRRWHRLIAKIPVGMLSDRDPRSRSARARRFVMAARYGTEYLSAVFGGPELRAVFGAERFERLREKCEWIGWRRFGNDLPEEDFGSYLPNDLLTKVDSASMAVALECRAPMLSSGLVESALCATLSSLMPGGKRKGLLRQVARKYLPAEIVDRPKMGFAIPIGEWFRSDYGGLRTMLLDHLNSAEPFGPPSLGIDLNMAFVRQMLDEHLGTGPSGLVKRDHSQRLYMLLVLSIWAKWLGGLRG